MLGDGRNLIIIAPHVANIPGVLIFILVMGINLLGDGLRDVLDPRLKSGALARPVAMTEALPAAVRRGSGEDRSAGAAPLLSVQNLETQFHVGGDVHRAVNSVSFDVGRNEAVGIVGEAGSGKSVTAMSILGLVPTPPGKITSGRILFEGEDLVGAPLSYLQGVRGGRIAYIFQDPITTLNPLLPVGEQVAESLRRHQGLSHRAAAGRAVELLDRVRIPEPRQKASAYPHQMSGGQRQRVVIAMALANDPALLIADEPTTALDVTTQARVLELLDELRRETGAALIFITHDLGVVSEVCDRVLVMYAGRIVETGGVAEVFERPRHPYTERLLACVPILGEPERAIDAIAGLPPALDRLPPGCAFAPRCPHARDACRKGEIGLDEIAPGHMTRCIRARELAP
jgi:peptide/nickel transport system permease protein